jgi:hypothetical protein
MANTFEEQVRRQAKRLQSRSYQAIEAEVTQKRLAWLGQHRPKPERPVSPRAAFELLFFDYMGLAPEELVVIEETGSRIVWLSRNPCPTLAACQQLGLDTRQVCRAAFEQSTQAFLSYLDPKLRFWRSYEEIRPYAAHCREMIERDLG